MQKKRFSKRAYEIKFLESNKEKIVIVFNDNYEILTQPKPLDFLYIFRKCSNIDFKLITFHRFVEYGHSLCQEEIERFEEILEENNGNNEESYSGIYEPLFKDKYGGNNISSNFFTNETRSELSALLTSISKKLSNELIKKFKYTKHYSNYFPDKDSNPVGNAPSLVGRVARFIISKEPEKSITDLNNLPEEEFEKVVKKSKSLILRDEKVMAQIGDVVKFIKRIGKEKTLLNT